MEYFGSVIHNASIYYNVVLLYFYFFIKNVAHISTAYKAFNRYMFMTPTKLKGHQD